MNDLNIIAVSRAVMVLDGSGSQSGPQADGRGQSLKPVLRPLAVCFLKQEDGRLII